MSRIINATFIVAIFCSISHAATFPLITSFQDGRMRVVNKTTYAAARDAESAIVDTNYIQVGQQEVSGYYSVYRSQLSFYIPDMETAVACTLYLFQESDFSTTDFEIYIVGSDSYGPTFDTGDYSKFDGRQTGTAHTGTVLNDTWNSSGVVINGYNFIAFNEAGIDSVQACISDTLRIALISKEDYNNSAPSGLEYLVFKNVAYLKIFYLGRPKSNALDAKYLWNNGDPVPIWR